MYPSIHVSMISKYPLIQVSNYPKKIGIQDIQVSGYQKKVVSVHPYVCINFFPFSDDARQSVVILMGSLAKHLDPSDPKVRPIMRQLILALNTPSQQVQEAVANCLPPLVPTIKEEAPEIVNNLIATLLGKKLFFLSNHYV